MNVLAQHFLRQAHRNEPVLTPVNPFSVSRLPICVWSDEVLHFHLLEFSGAENEVSRGYLVTKRFPDLGNSKGDFDPAGIDDVLVVCKDTLCGFGTKVGKCGRVT